MARAAFEWLEVLGEDHEKLHWDELRDRVEYGYEDEWARDRGAPPLPPPFDRRPRLGARLRVRDHFRRLIATVSAEMLSWQSAQRLPSCKLLAVLMMYQEVRSGQDRVSNVWEWGDLTMTKSTACHLSVRSTSPSLRTR